MGFVYALLVILTSIIECFMKKILGKRISIVILQYSELSRDTYFKSNYFDILIPVPDFQKLGSGSGLLAIIR